MKQIRKYARKKIICMPGRFPHQSAIKFFYLNFHNIPSQPLFIHLLSTILFKPLNYLTWATKMVS